MFIIGKKVLMVVDVLNDFVNPGGALYCGETVSQIMPRVISKIKEYINEGLPLIFIMDAHDPEDLEFKRFPNHCVYGTPGAQLAEEIASLVEEYPFVIKVLKSRFSGFFRTNLNVILKDLNVDTVEMVGLCTNICVLYTVEELVNRDYHVLVYKDGVTSNDREAHNWALRQMETVLGAEIV